MSEQTQVYVEPQAVKCSKYVSPSLIPISLANGLMTQLLDLSGNTTSCVVQLPDPAACFGLQTCFIVTAGGTYDLLFQCSTNSALVVNLNSKIYTATNVSSYNIESPTAGSRIFVHSNGLKWFIGGGVRQVLHIRSSTTLSAANRDMPTFVYGGTSAITLTFATSSSMSGAMWGIWVVNTGSGALVLTTTTAGELNYRKFVTGSAATGQTAQDSVSLTANKGTFIDAVCNGLAVIGDIYQL